MRQSTLDVLVYPPAAGPFSVYTQEAFLDSMAFAVRQYYHLDRIALSNYRKDDDGASESSHWKVSRSFDRRRPFVTYFDPRFDSGAGELGSVQGKVH